MIIIRLALLLLLPLSVAARAQTSSSGSAAEEMTVITADKLLYDYRNQFAVFDNNVIVVDPQMRLTSDKLTVRFDESNQIQFIEARGQVYIEQEAQGFTARAELATYHVKEGKIVLEDSPQVLREGKILQGGTITYWRFLDKLESINAKLIIPSKDREKAGAPLAPPVGHKKEVAP